MIDISDEIFNSGLEEDAILIVNGHERKIKIVVLNEYQLAKVMNMDYTGDELKILAKTSDVIDAEINRDKIQAEIFNNNFCTIRNKQNQWNGLTLLNLSYD